MQLYHVYKYTDISYYCVAIDIPSRTQIISIFEDIEPTITNVDSDYEWWSRKYLYNPKYYTPLTRDMDQ